MADNFHAVFCVMPALNGYITFAVGNYSAVIKPCEVVKYLDIEYVCSVHNFVRFKFRGDRTRWGLGFTFLLIF